MIAHTEFAPADVPRVIVLATAMAQTTFAFAPTLSGLLREWEAAPDMTATPLFFLIAGAIQIDPATFYMTGRR